MVGLFEMKSVIGVYEGQGMTQRATSHHNNCMKSVLCQDKLSLQSQHRLYRAVFQIRLKMKSMFAADGLHVAVVGQDGRSDLGEALVAGHADQSAVKFRSQALVLIAIVHQYGHFGFITTANPAEPADGDDLRTSVCGLVFRDESHFAVIVDKADSREPFMCCALA